MLGGKEGGEYNSVGYVAISMIFEIQGAFFFGTEPFDQLPMGKTRALIPESR